MELKSGTLVEATGFGMSVALGHEVPTGLGTGRLVEAPVAPLLG